jgi:hypothetical protein
LLRRGAPTRRASETVGSKVRHRRTKKKKRKNFKELFINLNGAPVGTSSDCLLADECAIKKDNLSIAGSIYNIQIFC